MVDIKKRNLLKTAFLASLTGCLPNNDIINLRTGFRKNYRGQGSAKSSLKGANIALTVGHGYHESGDFDSGALKGSLSEFDLNFIQGDSLAQLLASFGANVSLFAYENRSHRFSLAERGENVRDHDIHISLHHNAYNKPQMQGGEVLVCSSTATEEDKLLASLICENMNNSTGLDNRGVKSQGLGVLRSTPNGIVKCLTEPLFISDVSKSANEISKLSLYAAEGMARGIEAFWLKKNYQSQSLNLIGSDSIQGEQNNYLLKALDGAGIRTINKPEELKKNLSLKPLEIKPNEIVELYEDH